jgi:hypothetical protein
LLKLFLLAHSALETTHAYLFMRMYLLLFLTLS